MSAIPLRHEPSTAVEMSDATPAQLWKRVDRLLARARDEASLVTHGVELLEARRLRGLGQKVPDELVARERTAQFISLAVPPVLERIRSISNEPIVLVKGPELARRYPGGARGFGDLDLISHDAAQLQRALIGAGFVEINDPDLYIDIHHLRPLVWPALPLKIELHTRPKWPDGFAPPSTYEIVAAAVPAAVGTDGILTASPVHHALIVAAHGWAHVPLRRLRDVIDTLVLAAEIDEAEAHRTAERWGIDRLWQTTIAAGDELFGDSGRKGLALRTWARHLPRARERTVLESHLEQWLSPYWCLPPAPAARRSLAEVAAEFMRAEGDTWGDKGRRSVLAIRHAFMPRSSHDDELGPSAGRRRS
jgi:Uncharacterised nucleotidyltransferase